MQIKEAVEATGLSADTIRYYEKISIVPPIARDRTGQRQFSKENVDWMKVIYWLRKTGMSMKVMSRYAFLVHEGDHTIAERKEILREHGKLLAARRADLDQCDAVLAYKLAAYEQVEEEHENAPEKHLALKR